MDILIINEPPKQVLYWDNYRIKNGTISVVILQFPCVVLAKMRRIMAISYLVLPFKQRVKTAWSLHWQVKSLTKSVVTFLPVLTLLA